MHENEDQQATTSTTIDDLPPEVLCPIIGCLEYKERLKVAGVSSRWHSIIDNNLGRKLFIGKHCQFTPDDEERYKHHYVPIETLSEVGVNTCYVGEIVDTVNSLNNLSYYWKKLKETIFGPNIPRFKHPHLVKNIFFDGPIPSKYFDGLMKSTKNLERLDIHLSSLCSLVPANMVFQDKRKLLTLNIWGHKLTQGMFTAFYSPENVTSNLLTLLEQNHFESLQNFGMEYPFDLRDEPKVTDSVLEFLKSHNETLEKFKICINIFITEEPSSLESVQDREWVQKAKAVSKTMNLKSIEVIITSIYRVRVTKLWTGFIESQNMLETVMIMTFRLLPDILYRICEQNFRTLHRIGLTRLVLNDNGRFNPINCTVFRNCLNLKALFLEGMQTGLQIPGMIETLNLPPNLERIELGNIMMLSEDCHNIFSNIPALQEVYLSDAGHTGNFGVTLATIRDVIQNHRIKAVTLYGSLNGHFPDEGVSNEHPFYPVQITAKPFGMIEITLREDGFYRNVLRDNLSLQYFQ